MTYSPQNHPTDELLTEFALGQKDAEIEEHLTQCPSCARDVKEMRTVQLDLESLPEEEVPSRLEQRILNWPRGSALRSLSFFWGSFGQWYRNSFLIGLGVVLFAVFFYCFFVFVL